MLWEPLPPDDNEWVPRHHHSQRGTRPLIALLSLTDPAGSYCSG